jgi:hypothetical protein
MHRLVLQNHVILSLPNEKAGNDHVTPPVFRKRLRVEMWMYDQLQALYAKEVRSTLKL